MKPLRIKKKELRQLQENIKYHQSPERIFTGSEIEKLEKRIKKLEKQAREFETWETLICRHYKEFKNFKQKTKELWINTQKPNH
jgi:molecular chaperone GrpE (heat shock protein)